MTGYVEIMQLAELPTVSEQYVVVHGKLIRVSC